MIKRLKDLASYLDRKALHKEAVYLDYLIKVAKESKSLTDAIKHFNEGVLSERFQGVEQITTEPKNYAYYKTVNDAKEANTNKKHVLVRHNNESAAYPPSASGDKSYLKKDSFKLSNKEQITLFCLE